MNMQIESIALQVASFLYFISQKQKYQKLSFFIILAGIVCHFIYILAYIVSKGSLPVHNLSENLCMAGFAFGAVFLFFQYKLNLKVLGAFASLLLSIIMLSVLIIPESVVEQNALLKGFWFYSHIIFIFTGEAALALACGAGILYLLQEKGIKTKKLGFFFKRLPSLDFLDNVGYLCLSFGFGMLTIGLITGFVYAKNIWGSFWSADIKEIFSIGVWLVYAALLHLRFYAGWHGRKTAIMTILGFCIIIFVFLGVNMLLGGHHQGFTK